VEVTDPSAHATAGSGQVSVHSLALATLCVLLRENELLKQHSLYSTDLRSPWSVVSSFRLNLSRKRTISFLHDSTHSSNQPSVVNKYNVDALALDDGSYELQILNLHVFVSGEFKQDGRVLHAKVNGQSATANVFYATNKVSLVSHGQKVEFKRPESSFGRTAADKGAVAPLAGKITKIFVSSKTAVPKGAPLVVMEAMKMEHVIRAAFDGVVEKVMFQVGDFVEGGKVLVQFAAQRE